MTEFRNYALRLLPIHTVATNMVHRKSYGTMVSGHVMKRPIVNMSQPLIPNINNRGSIYHADVRLCTVKF